jgi:hypothetical protein
MTASTSQKPKRIRSSIIGEGDDWIPIDSWASPISDYKQLSKIFQLAENEGLEIPISDIENKLHDLTEFSSNFSSQSIDDFEYFIVELLKPYLDIQRQAWDANAPGASGVYKKARLQLGNLREIRKRLRVTQEVLVAWNEKNGGIHEKESKLKPEIINQPVQDKNDPTNLSKDESARYWEQQIANEIINHVNSKCEKPLARFHFLSFKRTVLFIKKSGWWHSIPGDGFRVAELIGNAGIKIIPVEVVSSKQGWVPYFGRSRGEERGFGWNEPTIQLKPEDAAKAPFIEEAMQILHKSENKS